MNEYNSMSVAVDVTNPGQFFACCGLLELAHRVWPGAEGWFARDRGVFHLHAAADEGCTVERLMETLTNVGIDGELSSEEREELRKLESRKRALKKELKGLTDNEEGRRALLGKRQREGALFVGGPFNLRIAWWQEDGDDVPKTFAGRQEVLRMATAMLSEARKAVHSDRLFEYRCLLKAVGDGTSGRRSSNGSTGSKVEPFYFDAMRFAHALDAGFSLDVQEKTIRATAAPVTELLALIGLQRFRPRQRPESRWNFEYWTWDRSLGAPLAATVASGAVAIGRSQRYLFSLEFRDNQKRYKAFGYATLIGGDA